MLYDRTACAALIMQVASECDFDTTCNTSPRSYLWHCSSTSALSTSGNTSSSMSCVPEPAATVHGSLSGCMLHTPLHMIVLLVVLLPMMTFSLRIVGRMLMCCCLTISICCVTISP